MLACPQDDTYMLEGPVTFVSLPLMYTSVCGHSIFQLYSCNESLTHSIIYSFIRLYLQPSHSLRGSLVKIRTSMLGIQPKPAVAMFS